MGLEIALTNALSGLRVTQTELQIISNNVSNAQTPGYSHQAADSTAVAIAGQGAGVNLGPITRNVNDQLVGSMRNETTIQAFAQTTSDTLSQFQTVAGDPNAGTSVANQIGDLAAAFQSLATTPSGATQKSQVVAAATKFASSMNNLAQTLQNLRAAADQQIQSTVADAGTQLNTIQQLNVQIEQLTAGGQPTATLADQRDLAIQNLAKDLNISTYARTDGGVSIYTTTGVVLLDSQAPTFTHTAAGQVAENIAYPAGFSGINLSNVDITTSITGGKIGALIQLRDQTLQQLNQQLDNLATSVGGQLNATHNTGASVPAPNSLTSTAAVNLTDSFSGTGTVRIAVVDQNGNAQAAPLDLNLATVAPATVAGLVAAINTGLGAAGTASVTNGKLVITATNPSYGIAINQQTTNVNGSGKGFSSFYGLNDFFVFTPGASQAQTIAVRSDIAANPNLVATGTLTTAALAIGQTAVPAGDNSVVQAIANNFNTAVSIPAAGGFAATTATVGNYAGTIISTAALNAANAKDTATFQSSLLQNLQNQANSVSGVNVNEELANLTLYQNAYAASARVISVVAAMFQTLTQIGQ